MSACRKRDPIAPAFREVEDIPSERVEVDGVEQACYRMIFSADRTDTQALTVGIATIGPDRPLPLHRHAHSEIYLGIEGDVQVWVEESAFRISPGRALFVPGNLEHSAHSSSEARLLFVFAADSYQEVRYVYLETS